jgi:hypothetical protein
MTRTTKALYLLFYASASCFFVVSIYLAQLYLHPASEPKDFSFSYPLASDEVFSVGETKKEDITPYLNQPFYYLGAGKQMTAFESKDKTIVIKFFNHRRFIRRSWFTRWSTMKRVLSMKWISSNYLNRRQRLERLAKTQYQAYQDLQRESGILYVHVNKATKIGSSVILFDDRGQKHTIDLCRAPFVLQKKATLALDCMAQAYADHDLRTFVNLVESLADLFIARASKGYTDRIQTLHNNYGFIEGKAIQLDVGRLIRLPDDENRKEELIRIFCQLEKSVQEFFPDAHLAVHDMLEVKLANLCTSLVHLK